MDLIISFAVFMAAMIFSLVRGISMIFPLVLGLIAFGAVALKRGFKIKNILKMMLHGVLDARIVVVILLLIGCLTSLWRQSGTIAYFTYYGIRLIPPEIFVLAAFLLTSIMSYALGTSFGVSATMGVILLTIARASGISTVLTGGAVMSGLYFGDRASPASSSASLVANVTKTDHSKNIRLLLKTSIVPFILSAAFYALTAFFTGEGSVDTALIADFEAEFRLSLWCVTPTVLLLALAFAGMKIKYVMAINIAYCVGLTAILQKTNVLTVLKMTLLGFAPRNPALESVLSGGGAVSMLEVAVLLLLSSACAGLFEGTGMLSSVENVLAVISRRAGRFAAMLVTCVGVCAVFCNQTIGIIMCRQCMSKNYGDSDAEKTAFMLD
ncbi:MAG: hypothetical protein IJA26_07445, partial [Clostridia bacterium]|nr:hypothetical protein [Clostridia bacterium]